MPGPIPQWLPAGRILARRIEAARAVGGTGEWAESGLLLELKAGRLEARGRTLHRHHLPAHAARKDEALLAGAGRIAPEFSPLTPIPTSFWDAFIWHQGEAAWPEGLFQYHPPFAAAPISWHEVEILHSRPPRGGRPPRYDWPAFHAEALRRLEDEGGFHLDFSQASLERQMAGWTLAHWGQEPGEASIRRHVRAAHRDYQARSVK